MVLGEKCQTVDVVISVDHRIDMKESEVVGKYIILVERTEEVVKNESDSHSSSYQSSVNFLASTEKKA